MIGGKTVQRHRHYDSESRLPTTTIGGRHPQNLERGDREFLWPCNSVYRIYRSIIQTSSSVVEIGFWAPYPRRRRCRSLPAAWGYVWDPTMCGKGLIFVWPWIIVHSHSQCLLRSTREEDSNGKDFDLGPGEDRSPSLKKGYWEG